MNLKRRDFLKIVGASALGFPFLDCSNKNYHSSITKAKWSPNIETWIQSVCQACPGGCGILVRVVDGKAVKIEGNPAHPVNRGRLCPVGQTGLQVLYNPDRIKAPLIKIGKKDSQKWGSISWEEATDMVVSKLKELRRSGEAYKLAVLEEKGEGMLHEMIDHFLHVYGSPNHIHEDHDSTLVHAFHLTHGIDDLLTYDFENCNFILSFGSGFLTSWPSPVQSMNAYAYLRQGRPGKKAKIVQVEPRYSITASRSDKWIPIEPGTEGMLALGIAYVIIKERLYDRKFIETFTFGFKDWIDETGNLHSGFESLILEKYRIDIVSETTGVPVDTIISLAKEYAASKPAVAVMDHNATNYSNGLHNALAIHSLNALVGSIDVPGGVLIQKKAPLQSLPEPSIDEFAMKSLSQSRIDNHGKNIFPNNIIKGEPYPLKALFLNKANPLFSSISSQDYRKAFEQIPFIVSFSSFFDESSQMADLILPDKTYLEKWQFVESSRMSKILTVGIAKPVVEDLFNTRSTEDVFLEIAKKMGPPVAAHFPWKNSYDFLLYKIDALFQTHRGIIFADPFEETQLKLLEERGWWVPQFASAKEFNEELMKKGGWWDPAYNFGVRSSVFKTPSQKFEFYSQVFKKRIENLTEELKDEVKGEKKEIILKNFKLTARGDDVYMPHYENARFDGNAEEYPLYLYIYQPLSLSNEYQANLPWYQEIVGFPLNMSWDSWAEINSETAAHLGIADYDFIWLESPFGKIKCMAKVYPGAMPDVVSVPYGLGHKALGRWAQNRGVNPLELLGPNYDEFTGLPLKFSVRIRVYKA